MISILFNFLYKFNINIQMFLYNCISIHIIHIIKFPFNLIIHFFIIQFLISKFQRDQEIFREFFSSQISIIKLQFLQIKIFLSIFHLSSFHFPPTFELVTILYLQFLLFHFIIMPRKISIAAIKT